MDAGSNLITLGKESLRDLFETFFPGGGELTPGDLGLLAIMLILTFLAFYQISLYLVLLLNGERSTASPAPLPHPTAAAKKKAPARNRADAAFSFSGAPPLQATQAQSPRQQQSS